MKRTEWETLMRVSEADTNELEMSGVRMGEWEMRGRLYVKLNGIMGEWGFFFFFFYISYID